jgi:tetratricopeptide (TPR) repeat protein
MHDLFVDAQLLKGREFLLSGDMDRALDHFRRADSYPPNQGIGRLTNYPKEAQIYYYTGLAYKGKADRNNARNYFKKAADIPVGQSEYLYYKALSQRELNQEEQARASLDRLLQAGQETMKTARETDYFAKFGEEAGVDARKARAYFYMALSYRASGEDEKAQEAFTQALKLKNSILWAIIYSQQ